MRKNIILFLSTFIFLSSHTQLSIQAISEINNQNAETTEEISSNNSVVEPSDEQTTPEESEPINNDNTNNKVESQDEEKNKDNKQNTNTNTNKNNADDNREKETIQEKIDELEQSKEELGENKDKLKEELTNVQTDINDTKSEIKKIQSEIDTLEEKIIDLDSNIKKLETQIQILEIDIKKLQESLKIQKARLGQTLSFLYENQEESFFHYLFQSVNLDEFLNTYSFIQLIADQNKNIHDRIINDENELQEKKEKITISKLALKSKIKENEEAKSKLSKEQTKLKEILSDQENQELEIFDQIKIEEMKEAAAAEEIIKHMETLEFLNRPKDTSVGNQVYFKLPEELEFEPSKKLTNPMPGVRVSSEFGPRHHPVLGYNRYHNGTDIAGFYGDPIYSAANGIVLFAGPASGYGNWVVIYHGEFNNKNIFSIYAHMERNQIKVKQNQIVMQGQHIADVGSTGVSSGPHLHFGIAEGLSGNNFYYVNPRNYIDFD